MDTPNQRQRTQIDFLANNRGAVYEGDLFAALQYSPYVVRSFEFAIADGAIACDQAFDASTSYADRFLAIYGGRIPQADEVGSQRLLPFELKGKRKFDEVGGTSAHTSTVTQQRSVAFFIGTCASDPTFVEVTPNFKQEVVEDSEQQKDDERKLGQERAKAAGFLYNSRISRIPTNERSLDPSSSPYRMPRGLLLEAVRRLRRCALDGVPYVNPWTQVSAGDWRPRTTQFLQILTPRARTQHFSACQAALEVQRQVRLRRHQIPLAFDFVGLQPRLADFKLLHDALGSQRRRQSFVQHKLDAVPKRSKSARLNRVTIARGDGADRSYYFSHIDRQVQWRARGTGVVLTLSHRFDFLFYEFEFSDGTKSFFFIPERALPDDFYSTTGKEGDFEQFREQYYCEKDAAGHWVGFIWNVITSNPGPRTTVPRPQRPPHSTPPDEALQAPHEARGINVTHGRHVYREILNSAQQEFFANVMTECAHRQSGVLLIFAHEHPVCDFAYARYRWSERQAREFLENGTLPATVDDLRGDTPVVPVSYYTRDLEITHLGPSLTTAQFRRMNGSALPRLFVWNMWGSDSGHDPGGAVEDSALGCGSLALVPSEDIEPLSLQRAIFASNQEVDTKKKRMAATPDVSMLLRTGRFLSDYAVGARGPFVFSSGCDWTAFRDVLHGFATEQAVTHPPRIQRTAAHFRHPLRTIHQSLVATTYSHRQEL